MAEPVRLVIWDLDNTYWNGTLTEGGAELRRDTREIVIELSRRGIVNSICSKNDFETIKAMLSADGVWDYFVLPSLDWTPKGPRIQALIEQIGLRAPSVLFLDDNPMNLAEAAALSPGLQTQSEAFIGEILTNDLFRGKPDPELTRLKQYKTLETRKEREKAFGSDKIADFLRQSHVRVYIDYDVKSPKTLERAIELINRTNQLNFTKLRLPDDPDKARAELTIDLDHFNTRAGLIGVRDDYGDHGWCGFYLVKNQALKHFAFSCRILGMGVESWTYEKLGRPYLPVVGEVLSNPKKGGAEVDWITLESSDEDPTDAPSEALVKRVVVRGGCDLSAVAHYLRALPRELAGEFNLYRFGSEFRIDHSEFLRADGPLDNAAAVAELARLGFAESDYRSELFAHQTDRDVWLLSFWSDIAFALYRHKRFGFRIPIPVHDYNVSDAREFDEDRGLAGRDDERAKYLRRALPILREDYDYCGVIDEARFKDNLRGALSRAAPGTQAILLTPSHYFLDAQAQAHVLRDCIKLESWCLDIAREFPNTHVLNIRNFVDDESEVIDQFHFNRIVYLRAYRHIAAQLRRGEWAPPAPGWAFHTLADPAAALADCQQPDVLTRTATFLTEAGRAAEAEPLARRAVELAPQVRRHQLARWEALSELGAPVPEAAWRPLFNEDALSPVELHKLGDALVRSGAFADAEAVFSAARKKEPRNFYHRHKLAHIAARQGRILDLYRILKSCVDDGDDNPHVRGHVATLEAQMTAAASADGGLDRAPRMRNSG